MSAKIFTLPPLYKARKDGKTHTWKVWVEDNKLFKQDHIVGGKEKEPTFKICTIKNEGKKNERQPHEQAQEEAKSQWNNALDKGYAPAEIDIKGQEYYKKIVSAREKAGFQNRDISKKSESEVATKVQKKQYFPMLAMNWENKKGKIAFKEGAYIQPKADGVRALIRQENGNILITSRTGKEFKHFSHIREQFKVLFSKNPNIIFDGELYIHSLKNEKGTEIDKTERWILISSICSIARLKPHPREEKISYYIFDLFDATGKLTQVQRFSKLTNIMNNLTFKNVFVLPTEVIFDEKEIPDYHEQWVIEGYEGAIIRDRNAPYFSGKTRSRSEFLLKYKLQDSDEFEIVDSKEGDGTEKGCIVWICQTEDGKTFSCRPEGTHAERKKLWKNREDYIGQILTVQYQGRDPKTNIPRFPVGKQLDRWSKE
jgi:ATP-dependent DNA ligase